MERRGSSGGVILFIIVLLLLGALGIYLVSRRQPNPAGDLPSARVFQQLLSSAAT